MLNLDRSGGPVKTFAIAAILSLPLSACEDGRGNETVGTIGGAAIGAVLGAHVGGHGDGRVVGAAIGALAGAMIGGKIGRNLDRQDREYMERAGQQAFETYPSGRSSVWYNPDSGHRGEWTPQPAYQGNSGQYCREYTQTIEIGGQKEKGYGTACRQPDGSWKIVSTR